MPESSPPVIRRTVAGDAEQLLDLRRALFLETSLMLWEPAEFASVTVAQEAASLERLGSRTNSLQLIALVEESPIGFLAAMGGERNRLKHSALIALGVLRQYWSHGIASRMLSKVVAWAPSSGVKRLELTVHTTNHRAIALYQRFGFEVEGTRRCSLLVDGEFTDEYLMSHITGI